MISEPFFMRICDSGDRNNRKSLYNKPLQVRQLRSSHLPNKFLPVRIVGRISFHPTA